MAPKVKAQLCPENIGFENGNFLNWKVFTGSVSSSKITLLENSAAVTARHSIQNSKTILDQYGQFPVVPKNGGNYTVKLGNNGTGSQAEEISYLIEVPANRPEFTLTYQYAVVLEDPSHAAADQPKFIARVKDLETNQYIPCASFEYIATATLPGFKKSLTNGTVIYKDWTPVTINLSGYQGKKLLLEFITADCTLGGHFGYAYVDVYNLCGDLIFGNTYCKSSDQLNLSGPSGFQSYKWYNSDKSVSYGSGQALVMKPTPPEGTKIVLDLVPYPGFGCPSTVSAIVQSVDYQIQVLPKNIVCEGSMVDLLSEDYIVNKRPDFAYFAFEDKDLSIPIKGLVKITGNKTFYITATNYKGCESVALVDVSTFEIAKITSKNPDPVCYNEVVDLTKDDIYSAPLTDITKGYFTDAAATKTLLNPNRVSQNGRYYIQLTNLAGCSKILPVDVTISTKPLLKVQNPEPVCYPATVNISNLVNFAGSDKDLAYTFYTNSTLTQEVSDASKIDATGTYYVKAVNSKGCVVSDKINVKIYNLPQLVIKNPAEVCFPSTIDITDISLYSGSSQDVTYNYYSDSNLNVKLTQPNQIKKSGTYYVKITNPGGCYVFDKIVVTINPLPIIVLAAPKPIFDYDYIDLTSENIMKGSKGYVKARYYLDAQLTKPVPDPTKVNIAGVYYVNLESEKGCSITSSITLTILPAPQIKVPTAFTPQKLINNHLYPFFTSIQKLNSFKVYNKWGVLVYQTDDMNAAGWDGLLKSKMQPIETFSWFADGIDVLGGKFQSKGKTLLIL